MMAGAMAAFSLKSIKLLVLRQLPALLFIVLVWGYCDAELSAQDTLGMGDDVLLPEIMPREVEILGEFEASFPSFQRRGLTGFNPPPAIYEVPRGRIPFREDYRQPTADLPPAALADPRGPSISLRSPGKPLNGEVIVSVGRLLSRHAVARLAPHMSNSLAVFADGRYSGWSGFKPFPDQLPDLESNSEHAIGEAGLKMNAASVSAGISWRGLYEQYDIYGAELSGPSDVLKPVPNRSGAGMGGRGWIRNAVGSDLPFSLLVSYDATRYETALIEDEEISPSMRRAEKRLDAEGFFGGRFSTSMLALDGRITVAGLDSDAAVGRDHMAFDVGASLRLLFGRKARLTVGTRFLGYDVPTFGGKGFESGLYVSPNIEIDVFSAPGLQFFLRNRPGIEVHGLRDLYRMNPFIVSEPLHKPNVTLVNAEGGVVLFKGPVRLSGSVGYEQHPHYLFFERATQTAGTATVDGLFAPSFDDASIIKAGAEIGLALPGGITSSLSVWWRQGTLGDDNNVIPYFPSLMSRLQLSAAFAERKGLVKIVGRMSGVRWTDKLETDELKGFVDLDAEVSYMFTPNLGGFTRIEQMSEGRFAEWENYPTPPWLFMAGIRIQW